MSHAKAVVAICPLRANVRFAHDPNMTPAVSQAAREVSNPCPTLQRLLQSALYARMTMLLKQSKACMFKHVLEDHTRLYESMIRQTIQQLTL